jgi:hypothetical protein
MSNWISTSNLHLLRLHDLYEYYKRDHDNNQATEFSFTRFLVPFLCDYKGWAVFCDGDFLWVKDPSALKQYCDPSKSVLCVQHDITPKQLSTKKMDGKPQLWYERKNWSSLMLINCEHPNTKTLTPDIVSTASAGYLHRLEWAGDSVGALPIDFNFLVGYYEPRPDVYAYHYTDGVPMYPGYEYCDYSDLWFAEYRRHSFSVN